MRDGYSIELGELVRADELDYGMCEEFTVVCPACYENVLKKERARADGGVTHFLAHRARSPEQTEECERRVASMSREDMMSAGALARGQTLDRFFAAFERIVLESMEATSRDLSGRGVRAYYDEVRANPNFKSVCSEIVGFGRRIAEPPHGNTVNIVMSTIQGAKDVATQREIELTPRMLEAMRRLATDICMHVSTPQGAENLRTLLAAGAFRRTIDPKPLDPTVISSFIPHVTTAITGTSKLKFASLRRKVEAAIRANAHTFEPDPEWAYLNPDVVLRSNIFMDLFVLGLRYAVLSPFASVIWRDIRRAAPDWEERLLDRAAPGT